MARKSKSKGKGSGRMITVLHADAAGIDIGAEEISLLCPRSALQIRCDRSVHLRVTCTS